ncbi:MAG TPA: hypothetical protein VL947_03910, partial [Cytophagales bacterium]|nr:hypothetical protein [Cytophagales bacterium]
DIEYTAKGKLVKYVVMSSGGKIAEGVLAIKPNVGIILAYHLFDVRVDEVETFGAHNYWLIAGILLIVFILWYVYKIRKRRSLL